MTHGHHRAASAKINIIFGEAYDTYGDFIAGCYVALESSPIQLSNSLKLFNESI